MKLNCQSCGHHFALDIHYPLEIGDFVKAMRDAKCPKCGAGTKLLRVGDPPNPGLK